MLARHTKAQLKAIRVLGLIASKRAIKPPVADFTAKFLEVPPQPSTAAGEKSS